MVLPKIAKLALIVVSTPLILISLGTWITGMVFNEERWACINCRADDPVSFKQNFLFYTLWLLFLTTALFVAWAGGKKKAARRIFRVVLPHSCTVTMTNIYYNATNPSDGFFNTELCYTRVRAYVTMEMAENIAARDAYLFCQNVFDIFVHYAACPILLLLLFSGEIDYDSAFPYSTIFVFLLGLAIALSETFGSKVYCGGMWFNASMMVVINLVYHVLFVLWHRKICRKCCIPKDTEPVASDAEEKEAGTKPETEKAVELEA